MLCAVKKEERRTDEAVVLGLQGSYLFILKPSANVHFYWEAKNSSGVVSLKILPQSLRDVLFLCFSIILTGSKHGFFQMAGLVVSLRSNQYISANASCKYDCSLLQAVLPVAC